MCSGAGIGGDGLAGPGTVLGLVDRELHKISVHTHQRLQTCRTDTRRMTRRIDREGNSKLLADRERGR